MVLHKHLGAEAGLSLIEILMAIGILMMLFVIGAPIGLDFYTRYQFDSQTTTFISLLEQARNLALVNYNESAHGVYIGADNLIVFQGASFASRDTSKDKSFPRDSYISIIGPTEIVFSALSGQAASSTFSASSTQFIKNIYVNSEGTILY